MTINRENPRPAPRVLIVGAGPVGLALNFDPRSTSTSDRDAPPSLTDPDASLWRRLLLRSVGPFVPESLL